jgi:hypothetical protein
MRRLALIAAQALEDSCRRLGAGGELEGCRQGAKVPRGGDQVAGCPQTCVRSLRRQRREDCNRTPPVGDLDRFARLDAANQLACALSQLTYPCRCHMRYW